MKMVFVQAERNWKVFFLVSDESRSTDGKCHAEGGKGTFLMFASQQNGQAIKN